MNYFTVLMSFLRDRVQFLESVRQGQNLERNSIAFLVCSCLFFAIYGAIMGSFLGGLQIFVSAIKLPALYLLTLFICLPALFFFDVVSGSKRTFLQYVTLLLGAMAAISVMLFGFAPITLFFRLSMNDYLFFQLLNVAILAAASIVGINFFYRGMIFINDQKGISRQRRIQVIKAWLFLYAFVGSQLGWTLRPFFGSPGKAFELFRPLESNFYVHLLEVFAKFLGMK